ncbi:hypothetical protein P4056_14850 [Pseudomonas aeruginosa]|nr:hypothetical protein [Pseudomonas aeruginosa]
MSALMLQVVPPVQIRPDTWLQRFGIGPKTLRPPVAVAWSGAGQAIYQTLAVKVTREGEETPARKIATLVSRDGGHRDRDDGDLPGLRGRDGAALRGIGPRGQFVIQVTDEGDPRLGIIRWPVLDADTRLLSYDLTEGSGGRDPTDPAKVRAVVTVDGGAASRWVVVIERKLDGEWRVAGVGQTAESGRAEIALEVTAGGTTYAMGLDDWGAVFEPRLAVSLGQRVRPTIFSGWLYEVTEAGCCRWLSRSGGRSRAITPAARSARPVCRRRVTTARSATGPFLSRLCDQCEFRRPRQRAAPLPCAPSRYAGSAWCLPMRIAPGCGAPADHWHGVAPVAGPVYRCVMRAGEWLGARRAAQRAARSAWDSTRVLDVERARLGSDAAPA